MERQVNEYDVIILGSNLGGLISGTLLSRKNLSVLLLKESGYCPFYTKNGYRFIPFSNFSEQRLKSTLLRQISQWLDLTLLPSPQKEDQQARTIHPKPRPKVAFQVILPKARVDLFSQRSLLELE